MLTRDRAIAFATDAALEEYKSDPEFVVLTDAVAKADEWIVTFKVLGWLTSEWRVWEYGEHVFWELRGD